MSALNNGVPILVASGYVDTSSTLKYTVAAGFVLILTELLLVNQDSGALTPTVKVVTTGGSDAADYVIHKSEMEAGESRVVALGTVLGAGDKVYWDDGAGNGSKISGRVSGMLYELA